MFALAAGHLPMLRYTCSPWFAQNKATPVNDCTCSFQLQAVCLLESERKLYATCYIRFVRQHFCLKLKCWLRVVHHSQKEDSAPYRPTNCSIHTVVTQPASHQLDAAYHICSCDSHLQAQDHLRTYAVHGLLGSYIRVLSAAPKQLAQYSRVATQMAAQSRNQMQARRLYPGCTPADCTLRSGPNQGLKPLGDEAAATCSSVTSHSLAACMYATAMYQRWPCVDVCLGGTQLLMNRPALATVLREGSKQAIKLALDLL